MAKVDGHPVKGVETALGSFRQADDAYDRSFPVFCTASRVFAWLRLGSFRPFQMQTRWDGRPMRFCTNRQFVQVVKEREQRLSITAVFKKSGQKRWIQWAKARKVRTLYVPTMDGGSVERGANVIKTLARQGNSTCLILDRSLMDLLQLDNDSAVRITIEGRKMIVEPLSEEERAAMFKTVLAKSGKKNAKLFQETR